MDFASAEHEQYYRERIKEFRKIKIAANRSDAEEIKRRVKLNLEYNRIRRLQIKRRRIGWRIGVAMAAAVILVIGINFSSSLHQEKHWVAFLSLALLFRQEKEWL